MKLKPEQILQINFINWFKYTFPELADDIQHTANERKCSVIEGRILKRMGVMRGVSDIFLAYPNNDYHGLWIELKTEKGKVSPEQAKFLARKKMRGYEAKVAHGLDEAQGIVMRYLQKCACES